MSGPFARHFRNLRRHHFARTAPWRPKIDQDRKRRVRYQSFEDLISVHFDWLIRRLQFNVAFAATKSLSQPFVEQAIPLPTFWARHQQPAMISLYRFHGKWLQSS